MPWTQATEIYTANSPSEHGTVIFLNTNTGAGGPPDTWNVADLSNVIPEGTIGVHLTGIIIITHGTTQEAADIQLAFRKYGDTTNYPAVAQCVEGAVANGQRSTMGCWCNVSEDRKIEYKYYKSTQGLWPTHCVYGLNLHVDAYTK